MAKRYQKSWLHKGKPELPVEPKRVRKIIKPKRFNPERHRQNMLVKAEILRKYPHLREVCTLPRLKGGKRER